MNGDDVTIGWADAREANLRNWEDRVPVHEEAYGLDAYDDPDHRGTVVDHDLAAMRPFLPDGSLAGLDLCHLQCHIGTDTIGLARAGARVTGVDFSPSALEAAARLAAKHGIDATWVETDVLDARAAVDGDFDVVYTSIGAITWLADLDRWAAQVAALLRPGGLFYIRDGHPALYALDEESDHLVTRYRYFGNGTSTAWDIATSYVSDAQIAHTRTYEWPHPLSEVVNALLGAGLRLERLDEGTVLPWQFSKRMVKVDGGFAWPDAERAMMPCTFTVVARRD
ncbi:class I SAM-dependent methyltransferase [Xylanimonas protaetiae]|uniref:Class I SAM-dependent methyltransferase n=1 Tax=Xylanimonas protaetiae TaxID=2509457 RepID=A0A4P6FA89_9MICO|nr:class I SAM-dependent methyltransferase [Xylanimonas protaetiae]QAY70307.1 class I SAM-dependent methyltransferase [Xylanimonas protaetiae]